MGLIREVGKVTIITNYMSGNNLFELVHDPEKKVWSAKYTNNNYIHIRDINNRSALTIIIITTFSFDEKLSISAQISQALVYMHSCNPPIVHLDLKPENVLVCSHVL